jgi:threonine dehydrogenase-like Zn-dependent dehydrogenase
MPSLITLSDVMGTGHHAALAANVGPSKTAAVVGDGAVGLCGVIAAKRRSASSGSWMALVSQRQYAKRRGISQAAV